MLGGLTKEEALEKYPEAVELHKDPVNTDPEGESQKDFIERVLDSFDSVCKQPYETIAIVSHGGPLKVIMRYLNMTLPDKIGDGEVFEVEVAQVSLP